MIKISGNKWKHIQPYQISSTIYYALLSKKFGHNLENPSELDDFLQDLAQLVYDNIEFV